jgi:chorismate mutase
MADEHDIGGGSEKPPAPPGRGARPADAPAADGAPDETAAARRGEAQVDDLRRRIDQIDDQLMRLLNSRSACAVEIGRIKRRIGMAVYQPEREKWILERAERNNPGPLDSGAVRRVFERVIDESRRLERLAGEMFDPREARGDLGGASEKDPA